MNIWVLVLFITCLFYANGEGFFSKFTNRARNGNNQPKKDFVLDTCETVRVMPRIAMAVVGGTPLKFENSAPYIAALGERTSNGSFNWFCGGSLISPYDVLTAAHCIISRNVSVIKVGSFSTEKRSDGENYQVLDTYIHPGYKITESYNDVAIIKVKNRIAFDVNIKPICLPQGDRDKYEKERARVIGWGAEEFGGERSEALQQVEVEVFSNANCEKAYRNSTLAPKTFPKGIKAEQLCAGSKKGGKDACQGDSGGPLVLSDEHGIVRQIGIVSTGAGCGSKMYPGVYARVSSYIDWIQDQIKNSPQERNSSGGSENTNQPSNASAGQEKTQSENPEKTRGRPNHSQGNFPRKPGNSREVNTRDEFPQNGNFEANSKYSTNSISSNQKRKLDHTGRSEFEKGSPENTGPGRGHRPVENPQPFTTHPINSRNREPSNSRL